MINNTSMGFRDTLDVADFKKNQTISYDDDE
jgi:hypothetical protein